jgi:hypothetical protein
MIRLLKQELENIAWARKPFFETTSSIQSFIEQGIETGGVFFVWVVRLQNPFDNLPFVGLWVAFEKTEKPFDVRFGDLASIGFGRRRRTAQRHSLNHG